MSAWTEKEIQEEEEENILMCLKQWLKGDIYRMREEHKKGRKNQRIKPTIKIISKNGNIIWNKRINDLVRITRIKNGLNKLKDEDKKFCVFYNWSKSIFVTLKPRYFG